MVFAAAGLASSTKSSLHPGVVHWNNHVPRVSRCDPRDWTGPGRAAARSRDAVYRVRERHRARLARSLADGALAVGLSLSNWLAVPWMAAAVAAVAGNFAATFRLRCAWRGSPSSGLRWAAAGLWWGGLRLHELDRSSSLEPRSGVRRRRKSSSRALPDDLRSRCVSPALVLSLRRDPPSGACPARAAGRAAHLRRVRCWSSGRARAVAPRGPETGFDERGWLARRGIHVVLHASGSWQVVGRRGGIGGVGDRLRTAIAVRLGVGHLG